MSVLSSPYFPHSVTQTQIVLFEGREITSVLHTKVKMLQTFNLKENHAQSVPPHYQSTILNAFGACASNVPVNIISHLEAGHALLINSP